MENKYGTLITKDILLYRTWFKEFLKLHGIKTIYRAPRSDKHFNTQGDLTSRYYEPEEVNVIFNDHPDQKTLKKMGWTAELQTDSSLITVPYDLQHLEVGALFTFPSGLDNGAGRDFRVISMANIMIYPAGITCEVAPEYYNTAQLNEVTDFTHENFTVLLDNEGDD